MPDKPVKLPGPDHPITVKLHEGRVRVTVGGRKIADTAAALELIEASYPPVFYIPRQDADMSLLKRTDHSTYCPYKGDASYYSIPGGGDRSVNAVWSYEHPHPAMAQIKDYLAFYPTKVDSIEAV
ncbi:MAG TPA: DUF427 domain-containing protein [Rhizomicrobium sp.]|nr:DUF427 domain-containing protein [Rhizomicrobium sp.]